MKCLPVPVTSATAGKNDLSACYQFNNSLTIDLNLDWIKEDDKLLKQLEVTYFTVRIDGDNTVGMHSATGLDTDIGTPLSIPITSVGYAPIVFNIGPLPVVITPGYSLGFQLSGHVKVNEPFKIDLVHHMALGTEYVRPDWNKLNDFTIKGEVTPKLTGSLDAKARFTNDASVIFYGIAGPEIGLNPYMKVQYDFGQTGSLWAGADGYVGIKATTLFNFLNYRFNWQKESLLTQF